MKYLEWLASTDLAMYIQSSPWGYYGLLGCHAIGMGVVVGSIFMLCVRVLGYSRGVPIELFDRLFKFAWWGFFLNLASGLLLFSMNGPNLIRDLPFVLKIGFILAGGIATFIFWRLIDAERFELNNEGTASKRVKIVAVLTFSLWLAAIIAGRLIAYTIEY